VRGARQAIDRPALFIHPVVKELNAVATLGAEVGDVGLRHRVRRHLPVAQLVHVHVELGTCRARLVPALVAGAGRGGEHCRDCPEDRSKAAHVQAAFAAGAGSARTMTVSATGVISSAGMPTRWACSRIAASSVAW